MADKFQVKILTIGKAATEIEAENAEDAVRQVVEDYGKRAGEPAHMMARRLDKMAEVKQGKGAPRYINIIEVCLEPPKGMEAELADEIAEVLARNGAPQAADEEEGPGGP